MISYKGTENTEQQLELVQKFEVFGTTEIKGFEKIWFRWLSNEKVFDYLREFLPKHLEKCPCVQYKPEPHPDGNHIQGSFSPRNHEIVIWAPAAWEKFFEGKEEMQKVIFQTIAHEVGHNVHENMKLEQPEIAQQWSDLHRDGSDFVSSYAETDENEDFAESFSAYKNDPFLLQLVNPEKYEFMKREVFYGKEYTEAQKQETNASTDTSSELYKVKVSPESLQPLLQILLEQHRDKLEESLQPLLQILLEQHRDKLEESLQPLLQILLEQHRDKLEHPLNKIISQEFVGRLKDTDYNFLEVHDAKITATEDGFKIEGNFTAKHRELIFNLEAIRRRKHFTPWLTEHGRFSIPLSTKLEQGKVIVESGKPEITLTSGDFITLANWLESLWKDSVENKAKNLVQEKLNEFANGKSLRELIEKLI